MVIKLPVLHISPPFMSYVLSTPSNNVSNTLQQSSQTPKKKRLSQQSLTMFAFQESLLYSNALRETNKSNKAIIFSFLQFFVIKYFINIIHL